MHTDLQRLLDYLVLLCRWTWARHHLVRPRTALSGGVSRSNRRRRAERRCYRTLDLHRDKWLQESRGRRALADVVVKARACEWTRTQSFLGNEITGARQQTHFHHLPSAQLRSDYLSPVFRGVFYFLPPFSVDLRDVRHCVFSFVVIEACRLRPGSTRAAR